MKLLRVSTLFQDLFPRPFVYSLHGIVDAPASTIVNQSKRVQSFVRWPFQYILTIVSLTGWGRMQPLWIWALEHIDDVQTHIHPITPPTRSRWMSIHTADAYLIENYQENKNYIPMDFDIYLVATHYSSQISRPEHGSWFCHNLNAYLPLT